MKKLIVFVLLAICLGVTFEFKNAKMPIFSLPAQEVCFVDDSSYAEKFDVETVQCGDLIFNFCSLNQASKNIDKVKDFEAIQFYFSSTSAEEILKNMKAKIISEENVDGIQIVNAYTPFFAKSVSLNNKKVNLQIASKDGLVIAGLPMILTGY